MSQTLPRPMTADEFLTWDTLQPDCRHELIDGVPVAMTGATMRHDAVLGNIFGHLWLQLRSHGCRVFSADIAVLIPNGSVRRPDVGVRCPPFKDTALFAGTPVLVVEVLSPSTRSLNLVRKLDEYKSVALIQHVLLVEPDAPEVIFWSRGEGAGESRTLRGLDATVEIGEPALRLRLTDIYEGLSFAPRLVG